MYWGDSGGSFIVANKAYLNYGNNRKYVGTTEDIRTFNISTDWALGVEYPIFPRITFMVEPGIPVLFTIHQQKQRY